MSTLRRNQAVQPVQDAKAAPLASVFDASDPVLEATRLEAIAWLDGVKVLGPGQHDEGFAFAKRLATIIAMPQVDAGRTDSLDARIADPVVQKLASTCVILAAKHPAMLLEALDIAHGGHDAGLFESHFLPLSAALGRTLPVAQAFFESVTQLVEAAKKIG